MVFYLKDLADQEILFLLKELGEIPHSVPSLCSTRNPAKSKTWESLQAGCYAMGRRERTVLINEQVFLCHYKNIQELAGILLRKYKLKDKADAYSDMLLRAYELSGHPDFGYREFRYRIMENVAREKYQTAKRHNRRFVSVENVIDNEGIPYLYNLLYGVR